MSFDLVERVRNHRDPVIHRIMDKHRISHRAMTPLLKKVRDEGAAVAHFTHAEAEFLVELFNLDERFTDVVNVLTKKYNITPPAKPEIPPPPAPSKLTAQDVSYYGSRVGKYLLEVIGTVVLFAVVGIAATAVDAAYRAVGFVGFAVLAVAVLVVLAQRKS